MNSAHWVSMADDIAMISFFLRATDSSRAKSGSSTLLSLASISFAMSCAMPTSFWPRLFLSTKFDSALSLSISEVQGQQFNCLSFVLVCLSLHRLLVVAGLLGLFQQF